MRTIALGSLRRPLDFLTADATDCQSAVAVPTAMNRAARPLSRSSSISLPLIVGLLVLTAPYHSPHTRIGVVRPVDEPTRSGRGRGRASPKFDVGGLLVNLQGD